MVHVSRMANAQPDQQSPSPRPPAVPFKRSGLPRSSARPGAGPHEYRRDRGRAEAAGRAKAKRRAARKRLQEELAAATRAKLREVAAVRGHRVPGRWTPTTCVEILQAFYARHGRSPTMRDFAEAPRRNFPNPSTVTRLFGSWSAGLAVAGLPLNVAVNSKPRWTDEQILAAIREAALAGDTTSRPFRLGNRRPWIGTIERRFGSWRVAQAFAGLDEPREDRRDTASRGIGG